jgi:hypothetical protein
MNFMSDVTTSWKIANLERETATGKIIVAHYTIDATNGVYTAGAYGSLGFDGEVTIPYAEVTEQQVIAWVKDALTNEKVAEMESALENQIAEQTAPTKATGVPWVNTEVV